jgi:hypothetical protein
LRSQRILVSVLALAAVSVPAWATTITYSSQAALESANTNLLFTNISLAAYFGNQWTSVTADGVTITDSNNGLLQVGATGLLADLTQGGTIVVTLSSSALAFGVDLQNATTSYGVKVNFTGDGSAFAYTTPSGSATFFGAADSSSLTGLTFAPNFYQSSVNPELSGFVIGTGSGGSGDPGEAPEAATLFLIGGGLIAMRFLKKRDKARQAQPKPAEARPVACAQAQAAVS